MEQDRNSSSLEYVEGLYLDFLNDPAKVPPEWRQHFEQLVDGQAAIVQPPRVGPSFRPASIFSPAMPAEVDGVSPNELRVARLQERVDQLIRNYRVRGHMIAQLDPLGIARPEPSELRPEYHGFSDADLDRSFSTRLFEGANVQTLLKILERLQQTYCRSIAVQFMHIDDLDVREWLQHRMEGSENRLKLPRATQLRILTRLTDATIFEDFVRKKYVGAKSFSLEGGESLIPLLDLAIEKVGEEGVKEIVLAMAHRGRLNVLANVIGKSPHAIFREFDDANPELNLGLGDVKYHLGYSSDWKTTSGKSVHLSLCFNPSHLEFVNTVALGRMRAKQDRVADAGRERGMVLLIHGDAAFAGEGIVQETLNLSQLPGYSTGGTLHVIVNNQLGFTTSPNEGRSSYYATDVAKMLQIPIFHVNGEDPEAVAQVVELSMDFRKTFHRDVVIDMYCYRRWGHNEGDEPAFTQPLMYKAIEKRKSVRHGYLDHLLQLGEVTQEEADRIADQRREHLEQELSLARRQDIARPAVLPTGVWKDYHGGEESTAEDPQTGVPREVLVALLGRLTELPEGFHLHKKLERFYEHRREMALGKRPLDWASGEALAMASLSAAGHRVRLSGQDVVRGTFSQRHSSVYDTETGQPFSPFQHLSPQQGPVEIVNSPLSEAGVLGFEYGYSLDWPDGLVAWEAQFGDFVNAAQVIIDQFIASAEDKWRRLSGIVMLLPHSFEGQGPEHSSGRLERFLTQAADENMQVIVPSTPAQYFHCLRRQVVRRWRKPLVVMTPKSLLRHPGVVSPLEEFVTGRFQRVLPETSPAASRQPDRILLCSGKVYYELLEMREQLKRPDVPIVRLEQLFPFPDAELTAALEPYPDGTIAFWVQEEPENMGAWTYLRAKFGDQLLGRFPFRGILRGPSASPATGSHSSHRLEQGVLLVQAFTHKGLPAQPTLRV